MAQTFTNLVAHLIYSTKNREPSIDAPLLAPLHAYLGGIIHELNGHPLIIGGVADHVHLLVRLPKNMALPDLMRVLKANSSKWVHETYPSKHAFAWQTGYAAFSVSESGVDEVRRYIAGQADHHRAVSFQDEYRAFLRRHGFAFDERYIWE